MLRHIWITELKTLTSQCDMMMHEVAVNSRAFSVPFLSLKPVIHTYLKAEGINCLLVFRCVCYIWCHPYYRNLLYELWYENRVTVFSMFQVPILAHPRLSSRRKTNFTLYHRSNSDTRTTNQSQDHTDSETVKYIHATFDVRCLPDSVATRAASMVGKWGNKT